jgi:hypothetical protein
MRICFGRPDNEGDAPSVTNIDGGIGRPARQTWGTAPAGRHVYHTRSAGGAT